MHIIIWIAVFGAGVAAVLFGLVGILRDLLDRSPHEAPLLKDDGLAWPRRYRGITSRQETDSAPSKRRGYA